MRESWKALPRIFRNERTSKMELMTVTLFITLIIIDMCGTIYIIKACVSGSYKLMKWIEKIENEIHSEVKDT